MRGVGKCFPQICIAMPLMPSEMGFLDWVDKFVKDPNYKLAFLIESTYGTALWLHHAGTRANYPTLTDSASNISNLFSGLLHINGNTNYSQIEIYDEHLKKYKKNSSLNIRVKS